MIKSGTFYFFSSACRNESFCLDYHSTTGACNRPIDETTRDFFDKCSLACDKCEECTFNWSLWRRFHFLFVKTFNSRWKLFKWIEILFNSSYITRFNSELFLKKIKYNCSNMILYTYTSWLYKIRSVSMQLKIGILIFISICNNK